MNPPAPKRRPRRILAVASGGGHWVQLLRLLPAFEGQRVIFVSVDPAYRLDVEGYEFHTVTDATRWDKLRLLKMAAEVLLLVLRVQPHVVISTGAAPGYFALRFGKLLGARTVWLDSIANVEQLSLAGQRVRPHADLWLTQWPHLAAPDGPRYLGAVL